MTMTLKQYYRRQLEYDHWANLRVLEAVDSMSSPSLELFQALKHIVWADLTWMDRIEGRAISETDLVDGDLDGLRDLFDLAHLRLTGLLDAAESESLSAPVTYRNMSGQEFATPVDDIINHVLLHSMYHRGQVARMIRLAGGTPLQTDFIRYHRDVLSAQH